MSILTSLFRRAERKQMFSDLMKFDEHLLRDIGLTRTDIALMRAGRHNGISRAHE